MVVAAASLTRSLGRTLFGYRTSQLAEGADFGPQQMSMVA
jgi:hypothetical protein